MKANSPSIQAFFYIYFLSDFICNSLTPAT
ncbi:Uncharacterised protein [Shewanella putrefaciens]|nr:Uncharacterised protein [Shewanella putrefaciens]